MARIVIHIPSKKEWHYIGVNAMNTAQQKGSTAAVAAAKQGIYSAALQPEVPLYTLQDKLRPNNPLAPLGIVTGPSEADNELILKSDDGTIIYLIGVEIDVKQKNKIVATQLVNRTGTVKERIQREDYEVKVYGNLIGKQGKFPHEDLKLLVKILKSASSISCSAAYLDIFDINKLALKDAKFDQKGLKYFNTIPIELSFESDEDYDFLVDNT